MRTPAVHADSSHGPPFAREVASGTRFLETAIRPSPIRGGQRRRCAMTWHLFVLRVTVKDGERAFLTRNGRLERVLEPGRHSLFDPRRELAVELHNVVRAEFPAERFAVLKAARPDLAAQLFEAVETKADEVAIVQPRRPADAPDGAVADPRVLEGRDRASMSSASTWRATRGSRRGISRWSRASATRWSPSTWSRTTRPACSMSRAGSWSGSRRAGTRSGRRAARSRSSASTCVRRRWRSPRRRC